MTTLASISPGDKGLQRARKVLALRPKHQLLPAQFAEYLDAARLSSNFWHWTGIKVLRPDLRSSAVATWQECRRKFLFKERLGLKLKGDYSPARETGVTFHELMAAYYTGAATDSLDRIVATRTRELFDGIDTAVDPQTGLLPNGKSLLEVRDGIEKDGALALAMARQVAALYPREDLLKHYEIVGVEVPFRIRLRGFCRPLTVRIDMLLRHRKTLAYWVIDFKTTSLSPQVRAASLPFEFQPRFYQWVLWMGLHLQGVEARGETPETATPDPSLKIGGYIHYLVRKPTIRLKRGENFEEFIGRVESWYQEQATLNPNDPPVIQSVVPAVGPLLTEDLLYQAVEVDRNAHRKINLAFYPPNEAACFGKFGNSPCPYLRMCRHTDCMKWRPLIRDEYVQAPRETEPTEAKEL